MREDGDGEYWKYIIYNSSLFDLNDGDTVCRAMGYTHVVKNSMMTAGEFTEAYKGTYSFTGLASM